MALVHNEKGRLVEAEPRDCRVIVRFTATERAEIEREAKRRGLTISEYLRYAHYRTPKGRG